MVQVLCPSHLPLLQKSNRTLNADRGLTDQGLQALASQIPKNNCEVWCYPEMQTLHCVPPTAVDGRKPRCRLVSPILEELQGSR